MNSPAYAAPFTAALAFVAQPATAQDVQPIFDLPDLARGQVISSTAVNQGRHQTARRGPTSSRAQICAQRPRLRQQYGSSNPKVQELDRRCRRDGYGS